ncbi:MAG: amino acid ABC transporter permease, partial [Pseudomonadota bacterium]|nr:amino acid ABC transporter permease [Pseudomonadota bacterium]
MKNQTSTIVAARRKRRRNSAITDTFQLLILGGGIIWLLFRGAAEMNYVWQWHRVPQYIYKVIDGELIFGPLIDGLLVTLEIGAYSIV